MVRSEFGLNGYNVISGRSTLLQKFESSFEVHLWTCQRNLILNPSRLPQTAMTVEIFPNQMPKFDASITEVLDYVFQTCYVFSINVLL